MKMRSFLAVPVLISAMLHGVAEEPPRLTLAREANWLIVRGAQIPGGEIRTNYLEAYCRAGSTDADWGQHTVIPHRSEVVSAGEGKIMRLRDTLADGVIVEHTITAKSDAVEF